MKWSLRPFVRCKFFGRGEVFLNIANWHGFDAAACARDVRRTTTLRWIGQIDCIALPEKIRGPAFATIRGVEKVL